MLAFEPILVGSELSFDGIFRSSEAVNIYLILKCIGYNISVHIFVLHISIIMKESKLGDFEETILLLVGILGEEAYAMNIAEEFESQTNREVSIGAVHSTLNRIAEKGFLTSEMGSASAVRGGRRKRIYSITAEGKRALQISKDFKVSLWNQFPSLDQGVAKFSIR